MNVFKRQRHTAIANAEMNNKDKIAEQASFKSLIMDNESAS